jgi:ribonuclease HI
MSGVALFTDASLHARLGCGVGACLVLPAAVLDMPAGRSAAADFFERLRFQRFAANSSTALEVQAALWALESYRTECKGAAAGRLHLYSDSQCLAGLLKRRAALEHNDFCAKRSGRKLHNAALYRRYFELYDAQGFDVIKVAGHTRPSSRDTAHSVFSFLDREVRRALRAWVHELTDHSGRATYS